MKLSETGVPGIWLRRYPNGRERYGWTAIYGGQTYRRVSKRNSLRGAAGEREKALARLAAGQPVDDKPKGPPYTVAKAAADYFKACEHLRAGTRRRYAAHVERLKNYFGDLPVTALSQVSLAGFRKARMEPQEPESGAGGRLESSKDRKRKMGGAAAATINRDLALLRAALNHARGEGRVQGEHYFSALSKADRRKIFAEEPRRAGIRRVTDEQFAAVEANLPEVLRPVARLLLATAMRKGEALGLRWEEVRSGSFVVTRTKNGKPREIPMTPQATALLPRRPDDAQDGDLVFRGAARGDLRHNFDRAWRAAREAARLPWLRVHDLRHEAASRFLEAGGTSRELQVLGGWSSLELVERYSKVARERIRETLLRVALPAPDSSAKCTVSAPTRKAGLAAVAK